MNKATFIKKLTDFNGDARLYSLDVPLAGHLFVIVSAICNSYAHETYIFPADHKGGLIDWGELEGSYKNGTSHTTALENAGYEIISD